MDLKQSVKRIRGQAAPKTKAAKKALERALTPNAEQLKRRAMPHR